MTDSPMQSRAARMAVGEDGQEELAHILESFGFVVVPTGQENWLPAELHAQLRHVHTDPTVRAVRYTPDLLAWSPRFPVAWWDAKVNATPGTRNFSLEQACYDEQLARASIGQRVVLAFRDTDGDWYAQSVRRLVVAHAHVDDRHDARGSKTPYVLVTKASCMRLRAFIALPPW